MIIHSWSLTVLFLFIGVVFSIGCKDGIGSKFDEGPSEQPNFTAAAAGMNDEIDFQVAVEASREDGDDVDGSGRVILNGEEFDIDVVGATLSTDFGMADPIPQTDNLSPFEFVCTPAFTVLDVVLTGNGEEFQTTITLNECEDDNTMNDQFMQNGMLVNPCAEGDGVVMNPESFNGVCLENLDIGVERRFDTIVLGMFNGMCGPNAPCIVPKDVLILVLALNEDIGIRDDLVDIGDELPDAF